ncbi:FMN-dependent NADH-azoreductase [Rhodococcus jostii]|uniref:FMN-dependent NADH-azoreductase n=1 Tax=Rhodococcus jostii TaxID=132919 RepID=UPI00364D125B
MPKLLHVDSSADLHSSTSRELTARFAAEWSSSGAEYSVARRDLHTSPLPHIPTNELHWAPRLRTNGRPVPVEADALQRELIEELIGADVVVIGAPMYNWSIPSTLKAWIDYIHVPGITTTFDAVTEPLAGKPVIVVTSRGDQYGPGTPDELIDHQLPPLQQVLGVALGMDVTFVRAELTLAARIPAMASWVDTSQSNKAIAQHEVVDLARRFAKHFG